MVPAFRRLSDPASRTFKVPILLMLPTVTVPALRFWIVPIVATFEREPVVKVPAVTSIEPPSTLVIVPALRRFKEPASKILTVPIVSRSPIVPLVTTIDPVVTTVVPAVTTIEPPSRRPIVPDTMSTSTSPAVLVFTGSGVN